MIIIWTGACCAAAVPVCAGILMILCRREVLPPLLKEERPKALLRVSAFLYRKRRAGRARKGRGGAGADLAVLYPSRRAEGREEAYEIRKTCHRILILLMGSLLAGAVVLRDALGEWEIAGSGQFRMEREPYGGTEREEVLTARVGEEGQGEVQVEVPVTVSARRYTSAQLDAMAEELLADLPEKILGENTGTDRVCHDLDLVTAVEGYPFLIRWETEDAEILSDDGRIMDGREPAAGEPEGQTEGRKVLFTALLTAEADSGVRSYERGYVLIVFPPEETAEERLGRRLERLIRHRDEETAAEPWLELPAALDDTGQPVRWSEAGDGTALFLLLMAVAAALLYAPLSDRRLHRETILRERQLREDYPVLVSRLALYLGAGMSLRNIFIRIADDYRNERRRGEKRRYLSEEILLLVREMESGIPEAEAYTHFGARCRCSVYARLTSLLTQNLRKGNRALLNVLHREAQEAFQERRISARIRGEEAETRLLFPMVMMLAVTMLIIMIPAYLSFTV